MVRITIEHEGNLSERGLCRRISGYECTCDKCGKDMSIENPVYDFGEGDCCLECLQSEFSKGTVEDLIESVV